MVGERTVARTMLVAIGVLVGALAFFYVLYLLRRVVGALAIAAFVAIALAPAVAFVERKGPPRAAAILIVYITLLSGCFGLGLLLAPPLVDGVEQFVRDTPTYVHDIRDSDSLRRYDERYKITAKISTQSNKLPGVLDDAAGELEVVTVGLFERLFELITVLVVTFFFLLDGPRWAEFAFRRLPRDRERRAREIAANAQSAVGGYVAGTFAIAVLYGLFTFGVMKALGLPFAVPLAVFMSLCALIPLVGSLIGATPVALVAGLESFPSDLIIWVLLYVAVDQILGRVVGPYVYRRTMRLHPLLAIVSVLAGGSLLGILGALVAIPVAATIQIVMLDWWRFRLQDAGPEASKAPAPA